MSFKIAINGFGRIGRMVLRAFAEKYKHLSDVEIVAINDLTSISTNVHLFKYDSIHGKYNGDIKVNDDEIYFDFGSVKVFSESNPEKLPWKKLGIDLVLECSGRFTKKVDAMLHYKAGAKRVLVSAPSDGADITVVYGVNHEKLSSEHLIISNASCTTNCLAPLAYIFNKTIGIEHGFMTTIHAYTGDQRLVDTAHSDLRRSRAACMSMIPSSTGAAKAVGLVLPELKGKLDGTSIRVPVANVSVVDFKFVAKKNTSKEEINYLMKDASNKELKNILSFVEEELVSIDFNHSAYSSNFDSTQTQVIDQKFCRVLSWYDNEWGFSNRMLDVVNHITKL
jgi:glyceraldehyde 3-phosphate dehydrogenase